MKRKGISKITIILIIVILITIITLFIIFIPKSRKASSKFKKNAISSMEDFKSIEQAINYTGSTFISQKNNNVYLKFKYPLYTNNLSNQNYYTRIMNYVAKMREYKSFNLIDEEQKINIEVECDQDNEIIKNYKVNGISNFFGKNDSKIAIKNYSKINEVNLNIESSILKEIINKNWQFNNANLGTLDSSMDDYRIFFEEGYSVRVIESDFSSPKIFNIVFNSKYTDKIVNNIKTNNTFEEIENILGVPNFDNKDSGIIGYKSDKIYVFFINTSNGIEVSVYNVEKYDTSEYAKIVDSFISSKEYNTLIDKIFALWPNPDIYETVNNRVLLQYSNKGIKFEFNTENPSGITIYNNFIGDISKNLSFEEVVKGKKDLPDNIYFKNEDLILQSELKRINRYTVDDNINIGNELFSVMPYVDQNNTRILNFFSTDGRNPDFQIYDNVYTEVWADKTHFIYSIKNKGIYLIDVITRNQSNIVTGNDIYEIKNIKDGVLSYDDTNIKVNF